MPKCRLTQQASRARAQQFQCNFQQGQAGRACYVQLFDSSFHRKDFDLLCTTTTGVRTLTAAACQNAEEQDKEDWQHAQSVWRLMRAWLISCMLAYIWPP